MSDNDKSTMITKIASIRKLKKKIPVLNLHQVLYIVDFITAKLTMFKPSMGIFLHKSNMSVFPYKYDDNV